MKVYQVYPGACLNPFCEKDPENVLVWLEESDEGDEITIKVIDMPEEEYNNLPEYTGP